MFLIVRYASSLENKPEHVGIEIVFDGQVSLTCGTTKQRHRLSLASGHRWKTAVNLCRFSKKKKFPHRSNKAEELSQSHLKLCKINIKPSSDATINYTRSKSNRIFSLYSLASK